MTRPAAITAAILALLMGLVFWQIGSLALHADPAVIAETKPSPRALATARSFYDGMNRLFASGDRSIETTVAPGFIEHTQSGQRNRTLPEMIEWLLSARATFPRLQIQVLDMTQQRQLIAVWLEIDAGASSPFLRVPLATPAPIQVLEFLRVEGAGVTERWDAGTQLPLATLNLTTDFAWNKPSIAIPAVKRLLLDPGGSHRITLGGTTILGVESGSVWIDHAGIDQYRNRQPAGEPLDAGQMRTFAGADALEIRNDLGSPAEVWVFDANANSGPRAASVDATPAAAPSQTVVFMALQVTGEMRDIPHRVTITRLILPPGTTVEKHQVGTAEEIAVLEGLLEVTVHKGRALECAGDKVARPFDDTETIVAGNGISAKGDAILGYRAASAQPTTLLIMRIDDFPHEPRVK